MIEIKNFTKKYGDTVVYENFCLNIEERKTTCILGASGCGKTTLLNAVAGLIDYEGDIPRLKCSYVFQSPRLVPNLTVYGNLRLVCNDNAEIARMLERVGLSDKADAYPVSLSGGQAQRVALARAFLYPSDVILMDEPFSSLDIKLEFKAAELFSEIRRKDGRTALFVTHDVDEALCVADRIVVIKDGGVVADAITAEEDREEIRRKLIEVLCE